MRLLIRKVFGLAALASLLLGVAAGILWAGRTAAPTFLTIPISSVASPQQSMTPFGYAEQFETRLNTCAWLASYRGTLYARWHRVLRIGMNPPAGWRNMSPDDLQPDDDLARADTRQAALGCSWCAGPQRGKLSGASAYRSGSSSLARVFSPSSGSFPDVELKPLMDSGGLGSYLDRTMRASLLLLGLVTLGISPLFAADEGVNPSDPAPSTVPATRPAPRPTTGPVIPEGLGVNIHFTSPRPGEMEMLAAGGFRLVRMDFAWAGIERKAGEYDFSAYDGLVKACEEHHVRPMFILDYANPNYDQGLSPHTDEGRAAFAKWAAASAQHFKGRGVVWEMYNEPNIHFWKPRPNVDDYAKLAVAVGKALKEAAPGETYVGPATSEVDLAFIETCFKAGLLDYWSAVSVHPYRQKDPETVSADYRKLRQLIRKYAPPEKVVKGVPILSGEWGYSTAWNGFDEERQGKYLPRQWLVNLYNEVPVSVWYDWHDDGTNPKEGEHHFGTVHNEYQERQ